LNPENLVSRRAIDLQRRADTKPSLRRVALSKHYSQLLGIDTILARSPAENQNGVAIATQIANSKGSICCEWRYGAGIHVFPVSASLHGSVDKIRRRARTDAEHQKWTRSQLKRAS
jgi:hypothetical protein